MKKLLLVVLSLLMIFPAIAEEPDVTTAEGLQQVLGIDIATSSAREVKGYLDAFESAYRPYFDLRVMCFDRLVELGEEDWIMNYQQHEYERPNLMTMSFSELIALQNEANYALWLSDEWQEVEVPAGVYKIGEHIPSGTWQIYPLEGSRFYVAYGTSLNEAGTEINFMDIVSSANIYSTTNSAYDAGDPTYWIITLSDGYYIKFNKTVIFRKPTTPKFHFN